MRNITITLDDDTARWARMEAARQETSVSRFVRDLLRSSMLDQSTYEGAMASYQERGPRSLKASQSKPQMRNYPSREEMHDRGGLR